MAAVTDDATAGTHPLISVIITSFNYAHYISESIASVLSQDFQDLELIVIDNASTDATDEVVSGFAADPRLRYIKNETNIGLTANHNRALGLARGDYIVFVSADDRLLPGHLRRTFDYLQAHPRTDMVYTGVVFINGNSFPFGIRGMSGQLPVDYDGGRNEFVAQLAEGCYIAMPGMLVRRSLYDELGPFEDIRAADYEIGVRWAAAGKHFAYLRMPSVCIRLHKPQASGASYVADGGDLLDFLRILEKFIIPENAGLLQGFTRAIRRHIALRRNYYGQTLGGSVPDAVAARIDAISQRLDQVPHMRPSQELGGRPLISVVMRVETLPQLLNSLGSLAAQENAPPWEAIVVGEGGPDLGPLLQSRPNAEKIRYVRLDTPGPALARHTGVRLAAGRIITYLDPGNTFGPQHLARLAAAFDGGALVVRSNVRLLVSETRDGTPNTLVSETPVTGLFRATEDDDRDFVAATVPFDAIAHSAGTLERVGPIRLDLPTAEGWEYWLRLRQLGVVYNAESSVDVRVIRQRVLPHPSYLAIAQSLHQAYVAPPNSPLTARRAAHLRSVAEHLQRGQAAIGDTTRAIEVLATLLGIENGVATRTPT